MKRQPCGCQSIIENFRDFLAVDLRLENRTLNVHYNNVRRFLRAVHKNPIEITKLDIKGYLEKRMNTNSISTTNNDLKRFKRFFRDFLERLEVVKGFRFPQTPFKPMIVMSKKELGLAYRTIDSDIGRAVFLFYASTGLRRSEVLGLTVNEVDFKKRMIVPYFHNGTSKHSYVSFYNEEAEEALEKVVNKSGKLFTISDRQFRKIWKKAISETGLNIRPQRLREWFCCEMGNLELVTATLTLSVEELQSQFWPDITLITIPND